MSAIRLVCLRTTICFLVLIASARPCFADQGSEIPTESEQLAISELIQGLGAAKYRDRERAENDLRAKGLLALESLRAVRNHEDIEIRLRARNLARELSGQFIQQGVPPELQAILKGYESKSTDQREFLIRKLVDRGELASTLVLARLARFDESELLAREAALGVLGFAFDEADDSKQAIVATKSALGFSQRKPVLWIRSHLLGYSNSEAALSEFANWLNEERELIAIASASTDKSIVDRLNRMHIDMLLRAGKKEPAFDAMRQLDTDGSPTNLLLSFEWMLDREAWEVIEEFADKHAKAFEKNALLLYRLADVKKQNNKPEAAEETAKLAYEAAGDQLASYLSIYSRDIYPADRAIRQSPQDIGAKRYAMAQILENKFGLFAWAEREYRGAIEADVISRSRFDLRAMNDLSLMLHDQQDVEGSVEILEKLVKDIESSEDSKRDFERQFPFTVETLKSKLRYHQSILAGQQDELEKQRELLDKALELDPDDVDVIIAMYRTKDPPAEYRKKTLETLKKYEAAYIEEIAQLKKGLRIASATDRRIAEESLAAKQNQYAWLVGNTEGDIDKAIRASLESVRISDGLWVYLDTLGRAYYRKGDYENAVKYQRRAAKKMPHEGQIVRQLKLFEEALAKQKSEATDES